MNILLAPHNDDESLFAAYICMRYKPLVIVATDSFIQYERGQHEITAHRRRDETRAACKVLGVECRFLGMADDSDASRDGYLIGKQVCTLLNEAVEDVPHVMFVPAWQHGNRQHDAVYFTDLGGINIQSGSTYATYTKDEWYTPLTDGVELVPTDEEFELKKQALACYTSQHFQPHFKAVLEARSEWVSRLP